MNDKHEKIAHILCRITDDISSDYEIDFNKLSFENISLTSRIGAGLATYCKYEVRKSEFTITFGRKMIKSKFNPEQAKHWLTYREIINRHYFDGETTLLNLLAQTICHEFSHLIQQLSGWHKKGSIHNPEFYQILDYMHASSIADGIKNELTKQCEIAKIETAFDVLTEQQPAHVYNNFIINDIISFDHKRKTYTGKVIKVNRKTLIVAVKKLFTYSSWKIPKQLARPSL